MGSVSDEVLQSIVPADLRQLRACLFCSLVKTWMQFEARGCENCEFLDLEENKENIGECTSSTFEGMVAMLKPTESWVARWQRLNTASKTLAPGVYAVSVSGRLPQHVVNKLEKEKIRYISRDTTDRRV